MKLVDKFVSEKSIYLSISIGYIEKYFEVVMLVITFGFIGFIFVAWPKFNFCAIFLHLSWFCSTCVLIIGLLMCLMLFTVGLILNNGVCKASNDFLQDP